MPGIAEMDIPNELKNIQPFLQRSQELRPRDAFMSYQCKLYAAQLCYSAIEKSGSDEAEKFLVSLLDDLEVHKQCLSDHSAIHSDHDAAKYILDFSLKLFASALSEEQSGQLNKYFVYCR